MLTFDKNEEGKTMPSTSVTVRMDENLKKQAEALFNDMGLNMTTAFTIFVKAAVRQNKIPFEITGDPFWGETNQARITATRDSYAPNKLIYKTMDELEVMAHE